MSATFDILARQLPLLQTLRGYQAADLRGDLQAGITTAVMLIPQGMAYALLAGLPPIVGLYASTLPLLGYALLGTSRHLAVGPVAVISLLVATGVSAVARPGGEVYLSHAITLAAMVGLLQLMMGIGRLGFMVNFLSQPVVSGFTSAAALIIGLSQLKHLLGLEIARSHHVHRILLDALRQAGELHLPSLAIGGATIALLVTLQRLRPALPSGILAVGLSIAVTWLLDLSGEGVAIVGQIPSGLPRFALPGLNPAALGQLLPIALPIALVGFLESISVGKTFARKGHHVIIANRELAGLGLANLLASFCGGYPVAGGFSRTAVNAQAGARTGLAPVITALVITVTLLLLTPLFYHLPRATLAAIIMVAVFPLVEVGEVSRLYRVKPSDLALMLITFASTLAHGIGTGILVGVGASLFAVILRTTRPHTAVLGRIPGTHAWRSLERFPEAETTPGVIVLRVDAQFYFGNVDFLKETVHELEQGCTEPLRAIVLNASSINHIDSSADAALHEIAEDLRARGVDFYLAEVREEVQDVMHRSGLEDEIGADHFLLTVRRAVECAAAAALLPAHPRAAGDDPAKALLP